MTSITKVKSYLEKFYITRLKINNYHNKLIPVPIHFSSELVLQNMVELSNNEIMPLVQLDKVVEITINLLQVSKQFQKFLN